MPSPDLDRELLQGAMNRLTVFATTTSGDYISPLLAAYNDGGKETYENAVKRLRFDMQLVLAALRERPR